MLNPVGNREGPDEEEASGLLETQRQESPSNDDSSNDIPLCGFLSIRFYKPYFDVDTKDITTRLYHSVLYLKKDDSFMALISEKPDAYGPFWISTSLIFALAVSSHINSFLSSWMLGKSWNYDFQSFLTLASLIYSFAAGVPAVMWLGLRQFNAKLKLITAVCLYGYSLLVFIPVSLLCTIPSHLLSWLLFLTAGGLSTLFLLRNLAPMIVQHAAQHAVLILGFVGLIQFVFTLSVKFNFAMTV